MIPNIENINADDILLDWFLAYSKIQKVSLGGEIEGTLNAFVGASDNKISLLDRKSFEKIGSGAAGFIGDKTLKQYSRTPTTFNKSNNSLGLPNSMYSDLLNGVAKFKSKNFKDAGQRILSAIIGNAGGSNPLVNYKIAAEISLEGEISSSGSFPGQPLSLRVPGTKFESNTSGEIPYYNEPLGIVTVTHRPFINYYEDVFEWEVEVNGQNELWKVERTNYLPEDFDMSWMLKFNPAVTQIADIEIISQDIVYFFYEPGIVPNNWRYDINRNRIYFLDDYHTGVMQTREWYPAIRVTMEVKPKDGSQSHILVKTFKGYANNIIFQDAGFTISGPEKAPIGDKLAFKIFNIPMFNVRDITWSHSGLTNVSVVKKDGREYEIICNDPGNLTVTATINYIDDPSKSITKNITLERRIDNEINWSLSEKTFNSVTGRFVSTYPVSSEVKVNMNIHYPGRTVVATFIIPKDASESNEVTISK